MYLLSSLLLKKLSEIPVGSGGFFINRNKSYDKILGIIIPDLLMDLMSCHGFLKNKNSVVILERPKKMLEYYFPKDLLFLNPILLIWKNLQIR